MRSNCQGIWPNRLFKETIVIQRYEKIIKAFGRLGAATYLMNIDLEFLIERRLSTQMTCRIPQESVFAPLLWNIMYNGVPTLRPPDDIISIGFADNIGITIVTRYVDD